ncbi:DUF2240 family protein [[Eubacterium] cellulosolvens]
MSIVELKRVIASLFKRKGKDIIRANELELLASMELRWFEPADARRVLERAVALGLLKETETGLKITFNYGTVEIPLGFKPPKDLLEGLEEDSQSLFMQLVNQICMVTGQAPEKIIAELNEKQAKTENYFTLEVLALLYGKSKGVDMDRYVPAIKSKLLSNSG